MNYQIESALGHFVIVEPFEKSTVLQADETATVFKVVSSGCSVDSKFMKNDIECWKLLKGDLIAVKRGSIMKMPLPDQDIWHVYDYDIVALLKHD